MYSFTLGRERKALKKQKYINYLYYKFITMVTKSELKLAYAKKRTAERKRQGIKVSDKVLIETSNKIEKAGYKPKWSPSKGNWVRGKKK